MAININTFKIFVETIANKNGKATALSPAKFNSLVQQALMEWIMKRYDNKAEYQLGRPIPRVTYELTQSVMDDLRHLKQVHDVNVDMATGRAPIPNGVITDVNGAVMPDYWHLSVIRGYYITGTMNNYVTNEVPVKVVGDDKLSMILNSRIAPPTMEYPYLNIQNSYFQIYPKTFQYINLTYLRQPLIANWGYTLQNNRPAYNAVTSVDIDAPAEALNEIAMNFLSFFGINLREAEVVQYAQAMKQTGI